MRSRLALYPGGSVGAGLLAMRASVAVSTLMLAAEFTPSTYIPQFIGVLLAIGLCAGFQTRICAALSLAAPLLCVIVAALPGLAIVHAISAAALMMTGPGAFSIDARLFGRRTVTLPDPDDTIV